MGLRVPAFFDRVINLLLVILSFITKRNKYNLFDIFICYLSIRYLPLDAAPSIIDLPKK